MWQKASSSKQATPFTKKSAQTTTKRLQYYNTRSFQRNQIQNVNDMLSWVSTCATYWCGPTCIFYTFFFSKTTVEPDRSHSSWVTAQRFEAKWMVFDWHSTMKVPCFMSRNPPKWVFMTCFERYAQLFPFLCHSISQTTGSRPRTLAGNFAYTVATGCTLWVVLSR